MTDGSICLIASLLRPSFGDSQSLFIVFIWDFHTILSMITDFREMCSRSDRGPKNNFCQKGHCPLTFYEVRCEEYATRLVYMRHSIREEKIL